MKILWLPQFSSVKDGLYYINSDSNYNFMINMILGIIRESNGDVIFDIIVPKKVDIDSYKQMYSDLPYRDKVFFHPHEMTTSVFGSRYDFDYEAMKKKVLVYKPDIIWENNPVHARAWRTICKELKFDVKIISYFHWIDGPLNPKVDENISYRWRQFEGAETSDLIFFNSDYAIKQFCDNIYELTSSGSMEAGIYSKSFKIPPPLNLGILSPKSDWKTGNGIIFNHRLSSLLYYKENFDILIKFLNILWDEEKIAPRVFFTNPSRKNAPEFHLNGDNFVQFMDLDLRGYYKLLSEESIGVAPNFFFSSKGMWSIASVEAAAFGNALILPCRFGYKEIAPEKYYGFYETEMEAYRTFRDAIIHKDFRDDLSKQYQQFIKELSHRVIGKKVYDLMKGLI